MIRFFALFILLISIATCSRENSEYDGIPPNILLIITDDQSWEHNGVYGDLAVRTPAIDRLASEGTLFQHAYTAVPSCSPSRAGILAGQDIYRLEEGGVLTGFIREKYDVFPRILESHGYTVGSTGKHYWPKTPDVDGAHDLPAGQRWGGKRFDDVPPGISKNDYVGNFAEFLDQVPDKAPFMFWVGISEPHLAHPEGLGLQTGIDTSKIRVPRFYPDSPEVRLALSDYLAEIEWADNAIGELLSLLEERDLHENTVVVYTSDNGMPFPRAKATLYDHGVRMPLVVRWTDQVSAGSVVEVPVSLIDLAPTFLDLAGIDVPDQMTGRNLYPLLRGLSEVGSDLARGFVVSSFEKHVLARPDSMGFPRRALHTQEWTYIVNYEPDRFPAGNSDYFVPGWDFYGDIDPSRIKSFILDEKDTEKGKVFFDLGFGKVPGEELYDKRKDPDMLNNLAILPENQKVLFELRNKLEAYLHSTKDPRIEGCSPWDNYNLDK